MWLILISLGLGLAAVAGAPSSTPRPFTVVGGNETTIERYPFQAAVLYSYDLVEYSFMHGGIIINNRSILTAGDLVQYFAYVQLRVRVGSTSIHSGGVVHKVQKYNILNQSPNGFGFLANLAMLRLASPISFNDQARPAALAGPNYNVGDSEIVWASGWSSSWIYMPASEHLRHVQIWTVNQAECKRRYAYYHANVTDVMMCAGWLNASSGHHRGCGGADSGGPLVHNGVVVGVSMWQFGSGWTSYFPGIYARVSTASSWIQANA